MGYRHPGLCSTLIVSNKKISKIYVETKHAKSTETLKYIHHLYLSKAILH